MPQVSPLICDCKSYMLVIHVWYPFALAHLNQIYGGEEAQIRVLIDN
jgi:hypothetical protein